MKKTLIATAIAGAMFASTSQAADFGGAYVGAQAGYAMGNTKITDVTCLWWCQNGTSTTDNVLVGGIRAGYNWTNGSVLYGVVADYNFSSVDTYKLQQTSGANASTAGTKVGDLGSARARLGFTSGDMAIYATGGWAYGKQQNRFFEATNPYNVAGNGKSSGYVFGFGADYAVSKNIVVGVEYSSYRFRDATHLEVATASPYIFKTKVDMVGVNVNYKF